jgi:hypothetical protein
MSIVTTNTGNNDVDDADNLLQRNMALVRILLILSKTGDEGLSTLDLLKKLKSSNYGQRTIKLGQKKGYIERVNVKMPKGQRGNVFVMNRLTERGKQVVVKLTEEDKKKSWARKNGEGAGGAITS